MARLPDIPIESWIADQQDLLQRKISGLFPALEFFDAANQAQSEIPADYPYLGGEESFQQEQERIRQLQEAEDRRVEQERVQQQYQQQATMDAANQAAQQQQEMQRQQEMALQAQQTAQQLGIPMPTDVAAGFQQVTGPPGTGDSVAGTGAFDPYVQSYGDPAALPQTPEIDTSPYDFREMDAGAHELPPIPAQMETAQDFNQYAGGLTQLANLDQQRAILDTSGPSRWTPTETESREFGEATGQLSSGRRPDGSRVGESWLPESLAAGATRVAGGAEALNVASDALFSRIDPIFQTGLAIDGIIETDLSPAEKARYRALQSRQVESSSMSNPAGLMGTINPTGAGLSESESLELEAIRRRAKDRYDQIKEDPDEVTRYAKASPEKAGLSMLMGLASMAAGGGGAVKSGVSGAASALGASERTAKGAGYAADIAAQSAFDPTNLPIQGGIDTLTHGLPAAARAAGPTVRRLDEATGGALAYGTDLARRVGSDLGEGFRSTFNLPNPEVSDAAKQSVDRGVVPLEVRRQTTPEVVLPTDPDTRRWLEEAVADVDGRIDAEGVHIGVTRAFDPDVTDVRSTRSGVFLEPVREGQPSSYVSPKGGSVGGPEELPRTETAFRHPLVVSSEDFAGTHLDAAYEELGVQGRLTPKLERILQKMHKTEMDEAYTIHSPEDIAFFRQSSGYDSDPITAIERRYKNLLSMNQPDAMSVDELIRAVEQKFRPVSPKYQEAMQEIVRSFGGDAQALGDVGALKAAGADLGWIVSENIISTNARRKGYDGMLIIKNKHLGMSGSRPTISEIMDFQVSHIPTASTTPGGRPGFRLHPELDPEGMLSTAGMQGAIAAGKLPMSQSVREGFRRLFHGGQIGNERVDPAQFSETGMFGPAHYLTTSPDVADHYFYLGGEGSVIRPTDLNDKAILFNAERAVPQSDMKKIAGSMERLYGDDPEMADLLQEYNSLANAPSGQYPQIDGKTFYDDLARELTPPENWRNVSMDGVDDTIGDKRAANELLSEAGFDGVYYRGENTVRNAQGQMPQHSAVAIFPDALDSLRNGITGEMRGASQGVGSAGTATAQAIRSLPARSTIGAISGAGAGATAGDENTTPGERVRNAVVGGVLGSVGAQKGTLAAARLVDGLIAKGHLSADVLARHPETPERVKALFALAAKGLGDDEQVSIPGMVGVLGKLEPESRAAIADFIDGPKTAGQIRELLANSTDPGKLGREAQSLIIDLLAGTGVRGARAAESRADRATIEGISNLNPFRSISREVREGAARIDTEYGPAVRLLDDGPTAKLVNEAADDLGVSHVQVYVSDNPTPGAWATSGEGTGGRTIVLSKGLGSVDLNAEEMRALITHELAHTNEQSFGAELLGRAASALNRGGETAESLSGALRTPRRGVWRERVENGPEFPEGASPRAINEIQRHYDEAMRLLERSQTPRMKARRQISLMSDAHDAWEKYDAAVSVAKKQSGSAATEGAPTVVGEGRGTAARSRVPVPDQEAAGLPDDEAFPFGRTAEDAAPTPEPAGTSGLAVGDGASELAFDAEALPAKFDPSERIDHADIGRLVGQLNEELALDPRLQSQMQAAAVRLMSMPKPRAKHIEDFVAKIGERRAVARGTTKEEAGQEWADRFFRKNGWLAPEAGEAAGEAVPAAVRRAGDAATGAIDDAPAGATARDVAVDAANAAEDALEPTAAALREIGDSHLDDIAELENVPVEEMEGVIGRRKVNKNLQDDPVLSKDPGVQMFASPTPRGTIRHAGPLERIHNFWREKAVPALTDDVAILQGFQNDVAREHFKQTGKVIPHDQLAAEIKRFDPGRMAEMAVNRLYKPALKTFRRLELPNEQINRYLQAQHNLDIALEKSNPNRKFSGGTSAQDSQAFIDEFEKRYAAELGPKKYKELEDALQQVWDFGDHLLQVTLDNGLIDEAAYKAMRKAYPHYIPTKILDYLNDESRVGMGKSLSVSNNLMQELSYGGTDKEMLQPLAAMLGHAYTTYAAAQKNAVFNGVVNLWQAASQMPLPQVQNAAGNLVPATRRAQRIQNMVDAVSGIGTNAAAPSHTTSITGFVNGNKIKLAVDPAVGDFTKFHSPTTIPVLSGLMSAFRAGATSLSPVFLTANAALDLSNYLIRETSRAGGLRHPIDALQVMATYADTAAKHLPIGTMIGAGAGGYAGGQAVTPEDTMMTAAGKIGAGMGAGALAGHGVERLAGNKAISEIARHEYSGDMERYLASGGGTAGKYFEKAGLPPEPTRLKAGKFDLDSVLNSLGYRTESKVEGGVRELQREGVIEINSAKDLARTIKDMLLLKPMQGLGERIELVPRVAAMRNAERRASKGISALSEEVDALKAYTNNGAPLPSKYANTSGPMAGKPRRSLQDAKAALTDAQGRSRIEGVQAGRTVTMDFNKGGTVSRFINQFVPFFNVGMQGLAEIGRAAADNPVAFPAAVTAGVVGPVAFAEVWNNHTEQMRKDYADVPAYIKDRGLVVMLPESLTGPAPVDAQGNRHPQKFVFPYRSLAPFGILTREFMKRTITDRNMSDEDRRSMVDLMIGSAEQLSPIGVGSVQEITSNLVPPGVSTALQLGFDRDTFRGTRIVSKYADERASPMSKALAERFGGHASQWEFGTRDLGSGYAGMIHGASEIVAGTDRTQKTSPQDRPLTGGLYGRWISGAIGGQAQEATSAGGLLTQSALVTPSAENILKSNKIAWRPGPVDPEIYNVPLTRAEYGELQKDVNRRTDEAIQRIVANPRWQALPPAQKEQILKEAVADQHEVAKDLMVKKIGATTFKARLRTATANAATR